MLRQTMPAKRKDYLGFETDYVRVVSYAYRGKDNHHWWLCECKACQNEWNVRGAHIPARKSCGCRKHKINTREKDFMRQLLGRRWV